MKLKKFIATLIITSFTLNCSQVFAQNNFDNTQYSNIENETLSNIKIADISVTKTSSINKSKYKISTSESQTNTSNTTKSASSVSKTSSNGYFKNWSLTEAQNRVTIIGNKLLENSKIDKKVNFIVNNTKEVNAYADKNDNIVVYYGILPYCESEDELAFIIGHELGHISQKHVKKGMIARIATIFASEILGVVAAVGTQNASTYNAVKNSASVAGEVGNSKYSRVHENEADCKSIDFLAKAGYNPYLGMQIMARIGDNYYDFFKDHPSSDKRIKKMTKYISEKYPQFMPE